MWERFLWVAGQSGLSHSRHLAKVAFVWNGLTQCKGKEQYQALLRSSRHGNSTRKMKLPPGWFPARAMDQTDRGRCTTYGKSNASSCQDNGETVFRNLSPLP